MLEERQLPCALPLSARLPIVQSTLSSAALLGLALSMTCAAMGGPYLGGGVGGTRYDIDFSSQVQNAYNGSSFMLQSATLDRSGDIGYKAFVGYQFVPQFAIELAYVDLGKPKAHYNLTSRLGLYTRNATYRIQGLDFSATGTLPLTEKFSLHASVGAFYSQLKYSETGTNAPDAEPHSFIAPKQGRTDLSVGLGVSYNVSERWTLRADWDRFRNIGRTFNLTTDGNGRFSNIDLFTFNVIFQFRQ